MSRHVLPLTLALSLALSLAALPTQSPPDLSGIGRGTLAPFWGKWHLDPLANAFAEGGCGSVKAGTVDARICHASQLGLRGPAGKAILELGELAEKDPELRVRVRAIEALGAVKKPDGTLCELFGRLLDDPEPSIAQAALVAIARTRARTPELLQKIFALLGKKGLDGFATGVLVIHPVEKLDDLLALLKKGEPGLDGSVLVVALGRTRKWTPKETDALRAALTASESWDLFAGTLLDACAGGVEHFALLLPAMIPQTVTFGPSRSALALYALTLRMPPKDKRRDEVVKALLEAAKGQSTEKYSDAAYALGLITAASPALQKEATETAARFNHGAWFESGSATSLKRSYELCQQRAQP